ncbi:head decoration protein [Tumebacillus flagellatus]|uniref:Head decoration protein n=1 Tax=Tumebacillus flagellatus TaxID=1157490 RepID=A0A074LXD8_9BACL|nr:head decoration protein [Tumebacillus flagellatus]KEO84763.1 hypothetical protein EL26_01770 [Tumebacillus flagellatus]
MPKQLMTTLGSLELDNLFAGSTADVVVGTVTLKEGKVYKHGTVLGYIDAEHKADIVDSTKSDGTERPYGILADTKDATSGDVIAEIYFTGEFNKAALTFGGTDTAETHQRVLREIGIFLSTNQKA